VTNESAAKIVGSLSGVYGTAAASTVTDAGTIASGSYNTATVAITAGGTAGIQRDAGGTVVNQARGCNDAICAGGALALTNAGSIRSQGDAVVANGGGSVLNTGSIASVSRNWLPRRRRCCRRARRCRWQNRR